MRRRLWCTRADRVFQFLTIVNGAGSSRAVLFLESDLRFSQKDHAGQSAATTID
jgi:hypothetical protein